MQDLSGGKSHLIPYNYRVKCRYCAHLDSYHTSIVERYQHPAEPEDASHSVVEKGKSRGTT